MKPLDEFVALSIHDLDLDSDLIHVYLCFNDGALKIDRDTLKPIIFVRILTLNYFFTAVDVVSLENRKYTSTHEKIRKILVLKSINIE